MFHGILFLFFMVFFSHWKPFKTVLHLEVPLGSHHYGVITPWIFWLLIPLYKENICLTTVKTKTEQLVFSFNYIMRKPYRSHLPIVYCIKIKGFIGAFYYKTMFLYVLKSTLEQGLYCKVVLQNVHSGF